MALIKQFVEGASRMDRVEWLILGAIFAVAIGGYIAVGAPLEASTAALVESQP